MRRRERAREIARQIEENLLFEIEREWQRWMPSSGQVHGEESEGGGLRGDGSGARGGRWGDGAERGDSESRGGRGERDEADDRDGREEKGGGRDESSRGSREHDDEKRRGGGEPRGVGRDGGGVGRDGNGLGRDGNGMGRDGDGLGRDGSGLGRDGNGLGRDGRGLGRDGNGLGRDGNGVGRDGDGLGRDGGGLGRDGNGLGRDGRGLDRDGRDDGGSGRDERDGERHDHAELDGEGDLIGDEWDGPVWQRGRRFGGPRRPRFGRHGGPFPRPPWPRGSDEAQETQQWLAWMERVERLRSAHDRHHRRDRFRRRPWVWWLHAKLRQKIFVWLGIAIAIGLFAGGYLGRSGGSRGWMVLVVFLISWVGSGVIAWRMTRPLMLVVDAARAIGAGKLDTRIAVRGTGEVAILGTAINDMATRISAQLAEQRQLLAAVSHELRTPLGHLRVLLETARERGLPAPLFEQLEREVLDLDDLVGKLLASSRLEFGQLERKPIQLGELVAEAALAAGVAVEAISAEGNCQAQVDPTLVRRAVANLLDNAARHGGGAVAARVRGGDGEVTVEIDDAGPGVAAERRADAFSAFVPSAAGGLGLGLALVQRIAAAHRGSAWIADRPGGGARVGFSVAREMAPSRGPEEPPERASEKASGADEE